MQLNKDEIIRDGENHYSVFCILGSVIYVKRTLDINSTPYDLEDILKHYRKIEIIGDKNNG